ncbi:MAG: hypothetical protein ABIN83_00295 [Sphingomicrobium sp.]
MAEGPSAKRGSGADHATRPAVPVQAERPETLQRAAAHSQSDRLLGLSALFMSVLSLVIAYNQTRMMRQQVAAASWPLIQFSSSNTGPNGPLLGLSVQNAGVGPAVVKRFEYRYRGHAYNNIWNLLHDCCDYSIREVDPTTKDAGVPLTSFVEGTVIRPGESTTLLEMPLSEPNRSAWLKLDKARFELKFDACYCSVLGECWRSDLVSVDPQKVENCPSARSSR